MNQLTISAANAGARVASVDRDVASSLGAAECSSLSLSFSFVICICIQAFISASSPTRSLTLPLFLPFCISISLSLSLCGEWRGTESCRKHYVKWPPWLKIHPLHRATLATAAAGGSSSQTAWHATRHIHHVHIRRSICQMPQRTRAFCINTHTRTRTHRYFYS